MTKNSKKFRYDYSTEDLKERFSADLMARAARDNVEMQATLAGGPFQANWESLDTHSLPEWYEDAKFGMFVDWGLWSVPGWAPRRQKGAMYPDWYESWMYTDKPGPIGDEHLVAEHHQKVWGADFSRDDFLPLFTAADFDAQALVGIAREAGMRYVVPFSKHHGGFCLWECPYTHRNAVRMGPKRDLQGELAQACESQGLKHGVYFSLAEWEYPVLDEQGGLEILRWDEPAPYRTPYDAQSIRGKISGKIPVRDYVGDYLLPQCKNVIDRYDPDILWYDGEWFATDSYWRTRELNAYFYNHAQGRKQVVINDRVGWSAMGNTRLGKPRVAGADRAMHGDVFTSEYHDGNQTLAHTWEENRSIGQSYGYNREDTDANVLSPEGLVHLLVTTVSQGGNLLLIVNPTGTGMLPEMQATRLRALGGWMKVNGEAIYGTRLFPPCRENDVCFTRDKAGRRVYAISLTWPGERLLLKSIRAATGARISMLGWDQPLSWRQEPEGLAIEIPAALANHRPCDFAWTLRLEGVETS